MVRDNDRFEHSDSFLKPSNFLLNNYNWLVEAKSEHLVDMFTNKQHFPTNVEVFKNEQTDTCILRSFLQSICDLLLNTDIFNCGLYLKLHCISLLTCYTLGCFVWRATQSRWSPRWASHSNGRLKCETHVAGIGGSLGRRKISSRHYNSIRNTRCWVTDYSKKTSRITSCQSCAIDMLSKTLKWQCFN